MNEISQIDISNKIELAHLAILRKDYDQALVLVQEVLINDPANPEARKLRVEVDNARLLNSRTAEDVRIKNNQAESWRRDQAYQNSHLIDNAKEWLWWEAMESFFKGIFDFFFLR
jgi:hypothetical protein